MLSPPELKRLLAARNIRPARAMGQHFLVSPRALAQIIAAGKFTRKDLVLEIGPGLGAITLELSQLVEKVIAIERDRRLIPLLQEILHPAPNVEVETGDVLRLLTPAFLQKHSINKIIGTLPYYLSHQILRKISVMPPHLFSLFVLQQEVVEEAARSRPPFTALAIELQHRFHTKAGAAFAPSAFWPQPKVRSRILILEPKLPQPSPKRHERLARLLRFGFSRPRKLLISNLQVGLGIKKEAASAVFHKTGISFSARAEELSLNHWFILVDNLGEILVNKGGKR